MHEMYRDSILEDRTNNYIMMCKLTIKHIDNCILDLKKNNKTADECLELYKLTKYYCNYLDSLNKIRDGSM